ncbi:FKBP-type peptidyl-prolyl cis-trans isomerase [Arthrobacter sp. H20]|uniref:FKBP-type peptidyl-prolyl cis-trans isomerase n=1 Tax=Arthrobacter sp. H20 TaxID=1267981 RepID=UPI0004B13CB2|nr:FKBP-type peptidyl-prolyl cis-trans isomerase [Arthrobacter sp. H20]
MRKALTLALPLLLVLTACGGDAGGDGPEGKTAGDAAILESVRIDGGSDEEVPEVTFDSPLEVTGPAAAAITTGDGEPIADGDRVSFHLVGLNAEDGAVLGDTYSRGEPQTLDLTEELQEVDPELYEVLLGTNIGSQIAYTTVLEGQDPQQLIVMRVLSAEEAPPAPPVPEVLSPEAVEELDADGQLPTFTFDDDEAPVIDIPDNEPSDDLVIKVLEAGDGEVLTEADTISANYAGWRWEDGEQFDSSYTGGEPIEFPLTGVIEGWTKGLAGQTVGSKVLLVIPAPMGYGDPAPEGRPSGTLAFYVEIVEKVAAE